MVKCKKCKNPLPETAHYCPNCGLVRNPDKKKKGKRKQNESEENARVLQTDFGNYYDDIVPEDAEELKNRKPDNSLVLKFVLLGFGVAVMLAACITLLILFGEGTL
ncbi:MAG: zinc ribbon domain-containing protein [Clostridia bacterium]|nr:zinc ribbon domain-containing protein [Clostridia bacterium]